MTSPDIQSLQQQVGALGRRFEWALEQASFNAPTPASLSRGFGPTTHPEAWRQRAILDAPGAIGGESWCKAVADVLVQEEAVCRP